MIVSKFLRSVITGFDGFQHAVGREQNMRIHLIAAIAVIGAGIALRIAAWEWVAIVLCIGLVIAAECMNTAIERLADLVSLDRHPLIKQAKDCSSAGVLVLAITAVAVGMIILLPKIVAAMGW